MRNLFDESIAKKYKVYKNKLVQVKEVAKKLYYKNVIENNKSDPKKTWRVIIEILSQKHHKNNNIPSKIMDENNHTYANPIAISNAFNSYFARVSSTLASKIPAPSSKAKWKMNFTVGSFFLQPVTETNGVNILHSLDSSKSTGLHQIPIKFLKLVTTVVAPILTDMFNCCIQEGTYPDIIKTAQIIPIYKKSDKEKCSNYRPISLLSPM